MLCLRAFLPRHRLGQSADEDIGLMVLNDHAKGARHILNLGSREDLERHSNAPGAVRDRDTGACAANIERECNHLWTPRLRVQRIARGLESSSDARGILAASLRHGGLTATTAIDERHDLLDDVTRVETSGGGVIGRGGQ